MNRHNYFINILKKIKNLKNSLLKINLNKFINNLFKINLTKSTNNLIKKNLKKLDFIFKKDKLLHYLGIKRIFVFFLVLLFFIFSYFSTPYLYNSEKLIANIKNQLLKNLNLEFNLSANYSYNFLPKPHFVFQNSSFLSLADNAGEIKIYISPVNLVFPSKIKVQDLTFNKMNFDLNKKNYDFFFKLLDNDFSFFTLKVKNSNIFYRNIKNDVLFINKINELKYFYDTKNSINILLANNEIFNIPYNIELKNDNSKKQIISKINLDFINFNIENNFNYKNLEKNGLVKVTYNKKKSEGTYIYKKNFLKFSFFDKSLDQNFKYDGFINLKPFFSNFSGNLDKINLDILLNSNSILVQFLKSGLLNSKNLNIISNINSKKTSSFRDLVNLALKVKVSEGLFDLNETKFSFKDYADIKITDSLLYTNNNNLIFDALISVNINNINDIYKMFQTPLNNRKEIKKIEFSLSYNFDQRIANLNNIIINDLILDQKINKNINPIILKDTSLQNRIYIKKLVNQAIKDYVG